jgi:Na+/proline symporter
MQVTTIDLTALFIQQMTTLFQSYFVIMLVLLSIAIIKSNTKTHEWTLKELHLLGWALGLIVYYSYLGATTFWF